MPSDSFKATKHRPPLLFMNYLAALLLVVSATALGELLHPFTTLPNLVMLYLLAVVLAALKLGLRPAILTAVASVLTFDIVFVPSRFSYTVFDEEYIPVFLGLLTVGLVISSLVATSKNGLRPCRNVSLKPQACTV